MAHLHEKIDFTVAMFVVNEGKVMVIHHRKLDKWLLLGGFRRLAPASLLPLLTLNPARRGTGREAAGIGGSGSGAFEELAQIFVRLAECFRQHGVVLHVILLQIGLREGVAVGHGLEVGG